MTKKRHPKMDVILLWSNGFEETVQITPELEEMQALVEGYIEALTGDDFTMYINEEGKLNNLPVNEIATVIAREHHLIASFDVIVGNVFFSGLPSRGGYETELSTSQRVIILGSIARIASQINRYFDSQFHKLVDQLKEDE